MANIYEDISQVTVPLRDTFVPQVHSASANGTAIDVTRVGTRVINGRITTGAAVALTSLTMKYQASPDGSTGWVDIIGFDGNVAAHTTITAGNGDPEIIPFQLPEALNNVPYKFVRGVSVLVGTSLAIAVSLLACRRFEGQNAYQNAPPAIS